MFFRPHSVSPSIAFVDSLTSGRTRCSARARAGERKDALKRETRGKSAITRTLDPVVILSSAVEGANLQPPAARRFDDLSG